MRQGSATVRHGSRHRLRPSAGVRWLALLLWLLPMSAAASGWRLPGTRDLQHSIAVFGGNGTERAFSETLAHFPAYDDSGDHIAAIAYDRVLGLYSDFASLEAGLIYARHFGRENYNEVGATLNVRWFPPFQDVIRTSFAIGVGPTYTDIYPQLEKQKAPDQRSQWLNQFNLEFTVGAPALPRTDLMMRIQHRSGVFGLLGGVHDGSNFLTFGLRQHF